MLNDVRDGYGILYCIDSDNNPSLFECEWDMGKPINEGRCVWVSKKQLQHFKGIINESFLPLKNNQSKHALRTVDSSLQM